MDRQAVRFDGEFRGNGELRKADDEFCRDGARYVLTVSYAVVEAAALNFQNRRLWYPSTSILKLATWAFAEERYQCGCF